MNFEIRPIKNPIIIWNKLLPFISRAIEYGHGYITAESIRTSLETQEASAIGIYAKEWRYGAKATYGDLCGVCVAEVRDYPLEPPKRALIVCLLGGDGFDAWGKKLVTGLEMLGKSLGCDEIQASGRRGWSRKLMQFGWGEQKVIVAKNLRG